MIRLLPWAGADGKPCYLSTDGTGPLSRLADRIEFAQLGLAGQLLDQAQEALSDPALHASELWLLIAKLTDALRDTLRVAESRGARLTPADTDEDQ
ncbi:hypothetical protein OH786_21000 [Streptomyces atratus]|uniref:hypothetical protein n=1 Tax=Streptomyces atratus TaxID=1893 RepID=UPI00093058D7|nr:hypothetical protein [Streptomyces atratus]